MKQLFSKALVKKVPATFLKKRLRHKFFPYEFSKFLRTPFSQSTSKRVLLSIIEISQSNTSERIEMY